MTLFKKKEKKRSKNGKKLFDGGEREKKLFINFCFFAGLVLDPNPRQNRGMSVAKINIWCQMIEAKYKRHLFHTI